MINLRRAMLWSGILALMCVVGITAAWRLHKSRTTQLFGELVTRVATTDSVVALTFDDGPGHPYTDSVLRLLRAEQVPATFFVVGEAVARYPELTKRILEEGHELGNHSYTHRRLVLRSQSEIRTEVEATDSLLRATGADGRIYFRPPYGKRLVGLPWYLSRTGRAMVLWSIEPDSWYEQTDEMVRHVLQEARPGSIILLHVDLASRREERAALPEIISGLRAKGFQFVTLSELIARGAS